MWIMGSSYFFNSFFSLPNFALFISSVGANEPWVMGLMVPFKCVACFKTPLFTNGLTIKIA